MLSRLRAAGLVWPTILSLAALAMLVSLGNWQMSRKAWKDGLEARIAARTKAAPVPLAAAEASLASTGDIEYMRVAARGRFLHERELYIYAPHPRLGPGYHVVTPLDLVDGRALLVNRGYVTEGRREPSQRPAGQVADEVTVIGLVRLPAARTLFTPGHDAQRNIWYWRDLAGMAAAAFPAGDRKPLPFFLEADAEPAAPGGWPRGGVTEVKLANRHLEYALTWYGIAATLVGVYAAFAAGRLRSRGGVKA